MLILVLLGGLLSTAASGAAPAAAATPGTCQRGTLAQGALSLICIPASGWNGELIVFAQGYRAFNAPLDFHNLHLGEDRVYLPDVVQGLGFAFATTSYRRNGLAVLEGVEDVQALLDAFRAVAPRAPLRTYLTGVSQGGLVATLLAERSPEHFSGVLSACAPIGDFHGQLTYVGDFRVLFDYFFPQVLPGSAIEIPSQLIEQWETVYAPRVQQALAAHPRATEQLIRTSQAAVDTADMQASTTLTTLGLLWFSVFGTNDARARLGGNPYENRSRRYSGSDDDERLNAGVQRFAASPAALQRLAAYQPSGRLIIPQVTLHTTADPIIPFWHQLLYAARVETSAKGSFVPIPSFRYGHCSFDSVELLAAFGLLAFQASGKEVAGAPARASAEQARASAEQARQALRGLRGKD
ncbi:MAG TPA: hypothetical protein VHS99_02495 [Chloroflexota bacterium]|nr:hypothetical protein [Chloroflexota bacterium]